MVARAASAWRATLLARQVGTSQVFEDLGGTLDYDSDWRTVGDFMTLNLQVRYTGVKNTAISIGIDNALNEKPPFAIGDGDTDLYGFVSSQHDPRGAYMYGKVTYSF